jgi:acetyl-CoA carboxylase carboxyltransferase component
VNIVYREELQNAQNAPELRQSLIASYNERFSNPYAAAERGFIDDVIDPRDTRPRLIRALAMLRDKSETNPPKKHGNIPL